MEDREKELRAREAVNDIEKRKLDSEKKKNQLAIMEQTKADERMFKLTEDQKLELEIKQMKGALKVMEHMTDSKKKRDLIQEDLKEKEDAEVAKATNDVAGVGKDQRKVITVKLGCIVTVMQLGLLSFKF
ncbi:hypothetical protein Tco_0698810 [Tanacetum coccineum]